MAAEQEIVALMKGPSPPQTVKELVERLGSYKLAYVLSSLSAILNKGLLTREQLPWRKAATKAGRPRKLASKVLEKKIEGWIDEGGKDRVAAGKLLMELRQTGTEITGPPIPNDKEATLRELGRQMAAVGKDWTLEAVCNLWPDLHAILLPEALHGTGPEDAAALAGAAASTSSQAARTADDNDHALPLAAGDHR